MSGFIGDFLILFGVIGLGLLIYGWQAGWFIGDLVDKASRTGTYSDAETDRDDSTSGANAPQSTASRRRAERSGLGADRASSDPTRTASPPTPPPLPPVVAEPPASEDAALARGLHAANDRDLATSMDDIHPAVVASARASAIRHARATFPDHWSVDTINARPGWMLFDVADFLGAPITFFNYDVPGLRQQAQLPMYPIEEIRRLERSNALIATSRQKVITARWEKRKVSRANKGAA
ncbi:MAG: hypothetical protein AAFR55_06300 [Pseudomonadota bacterium]